MRLQELLLTLERIAPLKYAETWDNVGLLVGDPQQVITGVMLCIDYTEAVAAAAKAAQCNVVIAYHPPIFSPLKSIQADSLIFAAIQQGIAVYSPHTALDAVPGGVNDVLADVLELQDRLPLRLSQDTTSYLKLITFVPNDALEKVSAALFAAGAGHIGQYSHCSFTSSGIGTFWGEEGTNPTIGSRGRLERVEEIKLETILPMTALQAVIAALYKHHPYEEPAFDLVKLIITPNGIGQGRIGTLRSATSRQEIIARIKQKLGLDFVLVAGPTTGMINRAACLPGSGGGEFIDHAIAQQAQLYLTGEAQHHQVLKAAKANMTVVCVLHSNSERIALKSLLAQLATRHADVKFYQSDADRDPFQII
jgi:dinuclear metal center YbgI/SA1388 family protein